MYENVIFPGDGNTTVTVQVSVGGDVRAGDADRIGTAFEAFLVALEDAGGRRASQPPAEPPQEQPPQQGDE